MFPDLSNRGNVNKNETTYEMAWSEMRQEEAKHELNDAEKYDVSEIYTI